MTFPTFENTSSFSRSPEMGSLGIRFDPPRLFDVSVPPQLLLLPRCRPRPPRVAPITATRTVIAVQVCGIQWGKFTQPNARATVYPGFPECAMAAHVELSLSVRIYPAGWVSPVTHSADRVNPSWQCPTPRRSSSSRSYARPRARGCTSCPTRALDVS